MRIIIMITLCLFYLSGCKPSAKVIADEGSEQSIYLCDDLVKSAGPKTAYSACVSQAQAGNVHAQARLGVMYAKGQLGQIDWQQAMLWFLLAAKQGHPEVQFVVGQSYQLGRGIEKNEAEAFRWFTLASENYLPAQTELAICYLEGRGVQKDVAKSVQIFTKRAQEKDGTALYQLALLYLDGVGVAKNIHIAEKLLFIAAENDIPMAMIKLGDFYRLGIKGSPDLKKATEWYERSLNQKHAYAQHYLAKLILSGKWLSGYDPVFLLTQAANQSYAPAQLELAKLYNNGIKVSRNEYRAFQWYLLAAAQHEPEAMYQVGMSYFYGSFGQQKNVEVGAQYLKQAAAKGYYQAQYALASLYMDGYPILSDKLQVVEYLSQAAIGGFVDAQIKLGKILLEFSSPKYDKVAFYWINKAASENNMEALYLLGSFYFEGIGTPVDYESAFNIFSQLANNNHHLSEFKLGQMYYYGQGTEKDIQQAKNWYLKSAEGGLSEAKNWVAILFREGIQTEDQENSLELKNWVEYAANNGEPEGLYIKGINHLFGKNEFEQDIALGMQLLHESAEMQYMPAQRELGMIYEKGLFNFSDEKLSYQWYFRAAENGDDYSQKKLARLTSSLQQTAGEIGMPDVNH